jgi:aspartyl-tRNA(Asn)/glutamyl-tRNA(Gln) amidotransferase subunit A
VSRHGLVAYASSLDTVGACARDPRDLALWLAIAAGLDPLDSTSLDAALPGAELPPPPARLRIGVPDEFFGAGLDAEVEASVRAALAQLAAGGAELVPLRLATMPHAIPAYYLIATAEASSNLARYDGVRYGLRADAGDVDALYRETRSRGFGDEVKLRILLGTFGLSRGYHDAYYAQAAKVRTLIRRDFAAAFDRCDLLAGPTSPIPAFPLGSRLEDPLAMVLCDVLTVAANLAGIPALSIPCGVTAAGLPIGLQLHAPALQEPLLLQVAAQWLAASGHHRREPPP